MFSNLTRNLLWQRIDDWVARYHPTLIGVTGSSGKSIAKEALAVALRGERRVRVSHDHFHDPLDVGLALLGVPLGATRPSWFSLLTGSFLKELKEEEPDTVVVEVGADRPGYVDWIAQRLPFTVGVVTNIGTAHTLYYSSAELVAHEKMSLVVGLPTTGFAILNADDPLVADMAAHTEARVITYGSSESATVKLLHVARLQPRGLAATVKIGHEHFELHLQHLLSRQHINAVLVALSVAYAFNVDLPAAAQRLQNLQPPPGRLRAVPGKNGATILDDSYSASPETIKTGLHTLEVLAGHRKIAILGDVTELGGKTHSAHRQLGTAAAKAADMVIVVGEAMRSAGTTAIQAGADVHHFAHSEDVGKWLEEYLQAGDLVLVTGSREMAMEKVVERLKA